MNLKRMIWFVIAIPVFGGIVHAKEFDKPFDREVLVEDTLELLFGVVLLDFPPPPLLLLVVVPLLPFSPPFS